MTVPIISTLARENPNLRITVLSRPFAKTFFDNLAPNVGFMSADFKNEYKGIRGLNALYRRLSAKHFTAVADLHDVLRTKYLRMRFTMDRVPVEHVDKHRKQRRQLTSQSNRVLKPMPHMTQNYLDVLAKLGFEVHVDFSSIPENSTCTALVNELLGENAQMRSG